MCCCCGPEGSRAPRLRKPTAVLYFAGMIEARGLTKAYGDLAVLRGVDLSVASGEMAAIVGSSGAGKTTLLHILGTLDRPDDGSFLIDGVSPFQLSPKQLAEFRNRRLGFVFQFHHLLPEFTALENAAMAAYIQGVSVSEANQLARRWLDYLGLGDRIDHRPRELSGGEQQRVAVARALVNEPAVILADEPTGNLDSNNAADLHRLLYRLRSDFNQTVIIVTHNAELANLSDRVLTMEGGLLHESPAQPAEAVIADE